jgi:hypothetical protein
MKISSRPALERQNGQTETLSDSSKSASSIDLVDPAVS